MKELYKLHFYMRKVLTTFILANWGIYITDTSKYNQGRFDLEEAPPIIEAAKLFKDQLKSIVRKCKADDRITEEG